MKRERKEHLSHWVPTVIGLITSVLILCIGSFLLYECFWPAQTFAFTSITTTSHTYRSSEGLTYVVHGCKYGTQPITVDLQLEGVGSNHNEYPLPSFVVSVRAGCGIGINHIQLPDRMEAGRYVLRDSLTTPVNPFHSVVVTGVSNSFLIVNGGA